MGEPKKCRSISSPQESSTRKLEKKHLFQPVFLSHRPPLSNSRVVRKKWSYLLKTVWKKIKNKKIVANACFIVFLSCSTNANNQWKSYLWKRNWDLLIQNWLLVSDEQDICLIWAYVMYVSQILFPFVLSSKKCNHTTVCNYQ